MITIRNWFQSIINIILIYYTVITIINKSTFYTKLSYKQDSI